MIRWIKNLFGRRFKIPSDKEKEVIEHEIETGIKYFEFLLSSKDLSLHHGVAFLVNEKIKLKHHRLIIIFLISYLLETLQEKRK